MTYLANTPKVGRFATEQVNKQSFAEGTETKLTSKTENQNQIKVQTWFRRVLRKDSHAPA